MGAVKRSNSGGKERRDSESNSGGKESPTEAKKAKTEESSPVAEKPNPLGALAGLGDYSSSEEED